MRLCPAFNDDFLLCEEIHSIPTLTVEVPEEAILPAAEREKRHWGSDPDVNADVPDLCFVTEFSSSRATTRKQTRHVPVAAAIDEINGIVDRLNMNES